MELKTTQLRVPDPAETALVGRTAETSALRTAIARTAGGYGSAIILAGEAGIGKTRLMAEVLREAKAAGFTVLSAVASQLAMASPFALMAEAILVGGTSRPGYAQVQSLLAQTPVQERVTWGLQHRLVQAFTDVLEAAAIARPTLLALDDMHWADHATLVALRTASERLASLPFFLVLTYRPSAASPELVSLTRDLGRRGATELPLTPLRDEEVALFLASLLGAEPGPRLLEIGRSSARNPFLLTELVAAVRSDLQVSPDTGRLDLPSTCVPPSLRLAVERRLASLSRDGRRLLHLASLLGSTFYFSDLTAVAGRSSIEILPSLAELTDAGLIEEHDQTLRFSHDLIREQVYEAIPVGARTTLHRDVARLLAESGSPPYRIAHQYSQAGPTAAREGSAWLVGAARDAKSRDPQTAISLLTQALEALPAGDEARSGVRSELATLLAFSGRPAEAEELARDLLISDDKHRFADSLWPALVQALFAQGRWREVVIEVQLLRDREEVSRQTFGRLLAESALARIWIGDLDGAESDAEEAIEIGQGTGDLVTTCFALGHRASVASRRGRYAEALDMARRGEELARGLPEAERRHPHLALGAALIDNDRLEEAKDAFRQGQRLGERAGTVWDLPLYHSFLALVMFEQGEWDDAFAEAEAGLAAADETGSGLGRVAALAFLASIASHRGQHESAKRDIERADAILEVAGPQWGSWWLTDARAELEAAAGQVGPASARLWSDWQRGGIFNLMRAPFLARRAIGGQDEELLAVFRQRLGGLQVPDVPNLKASALVCRGLLENEPEALLRGADLFARGGRLPAEAAAREDAAFLLQSAGRDREARQQFGEACDIFARIGARHDLGRAMARMRSLGIRRGVRESHRKATSGWESLTVTEVKVTRLAAQGRTNPEIGDQLFISRRTVQTHLAHIFVKLDISSRVELAVMASRHTF